MKNIMLNTLLLIGMTSALPATQFGLFLDSNTPVEAEAELKRSSYSRIDNSSKCLLGNQWACYDFAVRHMSSGEESKIQNSTLAFEMSCSLGVKNNNPRLVEFACSAAGEAYEGGRGVAKDTNIAIAFYALGRDYLASRKDVVSLSAISSFEDKIRNNESVLAMNTTDASTKKSRSEQ